MSGSWGSLWKVTPAAWPVRILDSRSESELELFADGAAEVASGAFVCVAACDAAGDVC